MLSTASLLQSILVVRVAECERRCVKGFAAKDRKTFSFQLHEGCHVVLSKIQSLVKNGGVLNNFKWDNTVHLKPSNGAKKDQYVLINEDNFEVAVRSRHENLVKSKDQNQSYEFVIFVEELQKVMTGISRSSAKKRTQSALDLGSIL
jgi:hypothetical protein